MIYSHHLFARIQAKESWKFINSPVPVWLGKIISSSSNKLGIERRVTIIFENLLADCFLGIVHFSCPYLGFVRKWSAPSSNELSPFSPISRFNMYICIYVYMYICIYVYVYIYIHIYNCICMCICLCVCICICIFVYVYVYLYMYNYIHMYTYMCMSKCICICICIYILGIYSRDKISHSWRTCPFLTSPVLFLTSPVFLTIFDSYLH